MSRIDQISNHIFKVQRSNDFQAIALEIFHYQAKNNSIYKKYIAMLGVNIENIKHLKDIPFLPISFFKSHRVTSFEEEVQEVFLSSATTGVVQSQHFVKQLSIYETSCIEGFEQRYGAVKEYTIIGLLPSYLERSGSSLIYMVQHFMQQNPQKQHGFFKEINASLLSTLKKLKNAREKVLLIGVSYALMDLADQLDFSLEGMLVLETGGMKGKREELLKEELHDYLKKGMSIDVIHSEYGMTELLSQAYASAKETFICPPWMKVFSREVSDPFAFNQGKTGALNIIDLANIHSCSFIATDDLGIVFSDGSFKVLGRMQGSDTRGCNLLYTA